MFEKLFKRKSDSERAILKIIDVAYDLNEKDLNESIDYLKAIQQLNIKEKENNDNKN